MARKAKATLQIHLTAIRLQFETGADHHHRRLSQPGRSDAATAAMSMWAVMAIRAEPASLAPPPCPPIRLISAVDSENHA
jgi:hypothetical protein